MRWTQFGLLALLLCVSSGCWEFRRLPTDAPDAAVSVCVGGSCGAAGAPPDPFAPPSTCSNRRPSANPGEKLCRAGTLEIHCNNAPPKVPCPRTFSEAARLACEQSGSREYVAYCNACGGASVRVPGEFYSFAIHYDAANQLVGVTLLEDDPVGPCEQREFVFGTHCSEVEPASREFRVSCRGDGSEGTQLSPKVWTH
jgi:hypothetical protein